MTEHPITPPPELVKDWSSLNWREGNQVAFAAAARWGADQQLEQDAKWLDHNALSEPHLKIIPVGESLKEAMRPKPPSLKEQALEALETEDDSMPLMSLKRAERFALIRRALESLPD